MNDFNDALMHASLAPQSVNTVHQNALRKTASECLDHVSN
jgi:hypothetical protein